MNYINYETLISKIDDKFMVHREDDFVYLLHPTPATNQNILFQELNEHLIVWSNDYSGREMQFVLETICDCSEVSVIFPFIETQEEFEVLQAMGAVPIDFSADCCEEYSREYGSFLIEKRK